MIFISQGLGGDYMKAFVTVKFILDIIGIGILQCLAHFCCQNMCSSAEKSGLWCGLCAVPCRTLRDSNLYSLFLLIALCLERVHAL